MAYNTKPIVTDVDGNPVSQYYNPTTDQYEPVEGSGGGNKVVLYNADGTENNSLSLIPILEKLSELTGTVIDEQTRQSNEQQRITFYNQLVEMLNTGQLKGDKGDTGETGRGLEFDWDGTRLGVRVEGDEEYIYVDLRGPQGPPGEIENLTSQHIEDTLGYLPVSPNDLEELRQEVDETYQELAAHKADNVSQVGGVHGLIYEEGTWTPTLAGLNIPGVQTYSRQEGSYIRINNIVTVFFGITLTARDLSTSGTLIVTGLPFKPLGVGQNNGVSFGRITGTNIADPYTSIVAHASGNPQFTLFKVGQNTFASLSIADIADDFQILGSLTYKI